MNILLSILQFIIAKLLKPFLGGVLINMAEEKISNAVAAPEALAYIPQPLETVEAPATTTVSTEPTPVELEYVGASTDADTSGEVSYVSLDKYEIHTITVNPGDKYPSVGENVKLESTNGLPRDFRVTEMLEVTPVRTDSGIAISLTMAVRTV